MKDRNNADLLSEVLCACVKDMKQKKFLRSFREAASGIDQNQGVICENISCTTESKLSLLIMQLQNHLLQKGDVSKC